MVSDAELANALSAVCWRMALNAAKNLHQQDFDYSSDDQRIGVIREYLFFFIHCADRIMHSRLDDLDRAGFVTALALDCRRHYIENAQELFGRTTNTDDFIPTLNAVAAAYSPLTFRDEEPGFDMYRTLGSRIQTIMGVSQTNKWIQDQVMEIDGPEAWEIFAKSFIKLRRGAGST